MRRRTLDRLTRCARAGVFAACCASLWTTNASAQTKGALALDFEGSAINGVTGEYASLRGATWTEGLVSDSALYFDGGVSKGVYQWVDAGPVNLKGSMTVQAWARPDVVSGTHAIADNLYNYALWIQKGHVHFGVFDAIWDAIGQLQEPPQCRGSQAPSGPVRPRDGTTVCRD